MKSDVKTPYKIIFEDNHLLCVIKPSGVVTEADEYHSDALDTDLKAFIKVRDMKPGNVFLKPIHRLDKPASGIVIFAKTSKGLERMHALMRDRKIEKSYVALLEKAPKFDQGTLIHHLIQKPHMACVSKDGKKAELSYQVKEKLKTNVWVEVDLLTGRYHQIRAQFAAIGCPIVNDVRYGAKKIDATDHIPLIHIKSKFVHPVTGELVCLEHPLLGESLNVFWDKNKELR
jgi:23S rRNA pseudouridine1911/1915/1917 synthase